MAAVEAPAYCGGDDELDSTQTDICSAFAYTDQTNAGLDVFYLLFAAALVFFMQAGFAMLCAGSIRSKNVKNIMLKNILDACGGALGFWSVGYAFAYGGGDADKKGFIGNSGFFLSGFTSGGDLISFFFQFAFAATAATIVAGTVAERCKFAAYLCYSLALTGFVYPVVVYSIWCSSGFLSAFNNNAPFGGGMIDFAGSGVVHMTGGMTALIAAKILGPRIGRWNDKDGNPLDMPDKSFQPHSVALQVLGTFILWVGWYGFNPGSTLGITPFQYGDVAALCAVTTTLAAASGSVSALFLDMFMNRAATGNIEWEITMAMNGALSGLVAITAGCSTLAPWAAVVVGILAGPCYIFFSKLLIKLKIDDAVDAVPVHFGNGIWGCIAVGLFAEPGRVATAYGHEDHGVFYGGDGRLLAAQVCGVLWIIGWVSVLMIPFFNLLNILNMFRVSEEDEEIGLDISHHHGAAYNIEAPDQEAVEKFEISRSQRKIEMPAEDDK